MFFVGLLVLCAVANAEVDPEAQFQACVAVLSTENEELTSGDCSSLFNNTTLPDYGDLCQSGGCIDRLVASYAVYVECVKPLDLDYVDVDATLGAMNTYVYFCTADDDGEYCGQTQYQAEPSTPEEYCSVAESLGCCLPTLYEAIQNASSEFQPKLEEGGCAELSSGSVCSGFKAATEVYIFSHYHSLVVFVTM
jgi:hypothetical protein